jgi:hypothetical protein
MDDFLADMKSASEAAGVRLLDVWDFHWYPQPMYAGTYLWNIDDTARAMTADEIDGVLQGPRSYWDSTYVESSWITNDHLHGPAMILARLLPRLNAGYPGTKLGVSEYYPGGRGHVSSGLATADTLGVFQRMGVYLGAMWPTGDDAALAWSYGAFELLRDADGNGERYASTDVRVEHPEVAESSVYAGSDTPDRVTVSVINKTDAPRSFGLRIFHPTVLTRVAVYRIDAAHPSPILVARDTLTKNDAYLYAAPPMSAAMLVFTTR